MNYMRMYSRYGCKAVLVYRAEKVYKELQDYG